MLDRGRHQHCDRKLDELLVVDALGALETGDGAAHLLVHLDVAQIVLSHRGMYRYFRSQLPVAARPFAAAVIGLRAGVKLGLAALGVRLYERAH